MENINGVRIRILQARGKGINRRRVEAVEAKINQRGG